MNEQKQEQLQKALQEHPELNDRLKALAAGSSAEGQEKMIELLKEYGVALTAADFKAPEGELSDDEVAAVSGGSGCGCALVGGGSGDGLGCACIAGGSGTINGCNDPNKGFCLCCAAGAGATNSDG